MKFHPDKNAGDKDAEKKFQLLKEAKETLCEPERRALYDKWRNSGLQVSYKNWIGMKEHVVSFLICDIMWFSTWIAITSLMYTFFCLSRSNNLCTGRIRKQRIACCPKQVDRVSTLRIPKWDEHRRVELRCITGKWYTRTMSFHFSCSCTYLGWQRVFRVSSEYGMEKINDDIGTCMACL